MPTAFGLDTSLQTSTSVVSSIASRFDKVCVITNANNKFGTKPNSASPSPNFLLNENPFFNGKTKVVVAAKAKQQQQQPDKSSSSDSNAFYDKQSSIKEFLNGKIAALQTCEECRFVAESKERFEAHLKEPRHVNNYRQKAYMEPKKRQVWLKIWFTSLEEAESLNHWAFEVEEAEEEEELEEEKQYLMPNLMNNNNNNNNYFILTTEELIMNRKITKSNTKTCSASSSSTTTTTTTEKKKSTTTEKKKTVPQITTLKRKKRIVKKKIEKEQSS